MMTLVGRLCALCAVCALAQLALGDTRGVDSIRMIGGLMMLHLVISGGYELAASLSGERSLMCIFEILMQ